jgi:hypothetical protein
MSAIAWSTTPILLASSHHISGGIVDLKFAMTLLG